MGLKSGRGPHLENEVPGLYSCQVVYLAETSVGHQGLFVDKPTPVIVDAYVHHLRLFSIKCQLVPGSASWLDCRVIIVDQCPGRVKRSLLTGHAECIDPGG